MTGKTHAVDAQERPDKVASNSHRRILASLLDRGRPRATAVALGGRPDGACPEAGRS